jgi:hypothetical protein
MLDGQLCAVNGFLRWSSCAAVLRLAGLSVSHRQWNTVMYGAAEREAATVSSVSPPVWLRLAAAASFNRGARQKDL